MQLKRDNDNVDNGNVNESGASFNGSINERPVNFGANGPYETPFGASSQAGMGQPNQSQGYYQNSSSQPGGMPQGPGQPGGMPQGPGQPGGMQQRPGQPGGMQQRPGQPGGVPQNQPQGSVYRSGPAYDEPVIHNKGINPLFIIIPLVLVVIFIGVSQYKKIFGKSKYIPGIYSEGVLTNEYFNLKADFSGSGWDVSGYTGSAEDEQRALDAKLPISELYARNDLSIEIMDFTVYQTPYNVKETGADISSLMESYKDEYVKQLTEVGYEVLSVTEDTMTIAGKTSNGYLITCNYSEGGQTVKISLVQFFVFKGNYMGYFSAGSTSEGKAKLIISNHVSSLGD